MTITTRLRTKHQRERAKQLVDRAPEDWVCVLREETRNDRQNRAMWGFIRQLREALPDTMGRFSPEDCKLQFLHALGAEMRFLPELDGAGMFPVGYRSSTLTKDQFSALLEIIAAYAAKHGVELQESPEGAGSA
jgi:hypothetical protein